MRPLSSSLSKTRRRVYGLLTAGLVTAFTACVVGGLIYGLGRSQPDVTIPFSEGGQYVLLLGVINLGLYGAVFWQVSRLSRRDTPRIPPEQRAVLQPTDEELPPPAAGAAEESASGSPRRVIRRVRGTASSLNLDR